jgi:hypothetical protein
MQYSSPPVTSSFLDTNIFREFDFFLQRQDRTSPERVTMLIHFSENEYFLPTLPEIPLFN